MENYSMTIENEIDNRMIQFGISQEPELTDEEKSEIYS
jgi:hypothetical protein